MDYKERTVENGPKTKTVLLRRVCYQDEKERNYIFLTNAVGIEAEEVALLYKKRWTIAIVQENKAKLPAALFLWRE